jgi:hypothetical protein
VDTGLGSKEDPRFKEMFAVDRTVSLELSLKRLDCRATTSIS